MDKLSPTLSATVREQERRRLARLLEERLGGALNLLVAQANTYAAALTRAPAQARGATQTLARMAARALSDLRDLAADLYPSELADLGLAAALESLSGRVERRYGLAVSLDLPSRPLDLPAPVALAAYRVALEALHNAGRHAGAGRVGLSLCLEKNGLRLIAADDGDGFRPPDPLDCLAAEGKWGLAEMAERAAAVGGQVEVSSVLGVGTQVHAYLSLAPPRPAVSGRETVPAPEQPTPAQAEASLVEPLTPRERDVLAGVAAGLTNKQIAAQLGISDRTVQFHLGNVLGKLGVASRTEAAVFALQRGLVRGTA
jgi:DNA-binding CsgD family transcriptional regulator